MTTSDFLTTQGLPDGELLGAVLMVLIPVGIAYLLAVVRDRRRRTAGATPLPAPAVRARCDVTGCNHPAIEWRLRPLTNGLNELRHICVGCANEGDAHGWWRPTRPVRDELPYNQEAVALVVELDEWRKGGAA